MLQGCLEVQALRGRVQAESVAPPTLHLLVTDGLAGDTDQPSTSRRIDQNVQSWKSSNPHQISMIFFRVIMEVEEPGSDIREFEEPHAVFPKISFRSSNRLGETHLHVNLGAMLRSRHSVDLDRQEESAEFPKSS
jgi:hypothetical protein